jgi:hypothetical protein
MTKKCNPASPNRKQANISSFANTKKQTMQRSPQKHLGNRLLNKEKPTLSYQQSAIMRDETQLNEIGRDTDNPFHVLSKEDEVMEDAANEEMTQDNSNSEATEVANNLNSETNHMTDSRDAPSINDSTKD